MTEDNFSLPDGLDGLNAEDLAYAGLHRADERSFFSATERRESLIAAVAPFAPKRTRVRKPTLESRARQLLKAGQAAGVQIIVTIEGDKVTATPARGIAPMLRDDRGEPTPDAPPSRSLFKARAVPKQKVVL